MQKSKRIGISLILCAFLLFPQKIPAQTAVWENAVAFYTQYGSDVVFHPLSDTDGIICCCTKGPTSSDSIRYLTIGWKVTVSDSSGKVLQTFCLKQDGADLVLKNQSYAGGYTYCLYEMQLSALRSRLNDSTLASLLQGQCRMLLDACMTVTENGSAKGSMSENGTFSGSVYTTASGILGAEPWSAAARAALPGYFGKEIRGLFCQVVLEKQDGITSVSGAGNYWYGQEVEISAETGDGYEFAGWTGSLERSDPAFSVVVRTDLTLTAQARADRPPEIICYDRYYSLAAARKGRITEQELLAHIRAEDPEDGPLSAVTQTDAGKIIGGQEPGIVIADYEAAVFLQQAEEGEITLHVYASDRGGHVTTKEIKVYIRDTTIKKGRQLTGRIRFISRKYYEENGRTLSPEEGGLMEESVWIRDSRYRNLLESVLE